MEDAVSEAKMRRPPLRRLVRAVLPVAVVSLGFSLLVFWYTPAIVYATNAELFEFPLRQVLPVLALPMLAATIALTIPGVFLPGKARRFYTTVLGGLAAYAWVQGFFLVRDYGLLDGDVDLPRFSLVPLIVGGAIVLAVAIVLTRPPVNPVVPFVAFTLLVVLQAGHLATIVLADDKPDASLAPARIDPLYDLGRSNVLVVLLDSAQSDVVANVLRSRPEIARGLDGFTYYPNTLGVAPTTYGSLPTIHSGRAHARGTSMADFFDGSIAKDSFLTSAAADGVDVTLLNPVKEICPKDVDCFRRHELRERSGSARRNGQAAELVDLSFFRLAPPELKAEVYDDSRWRARTLFAVTSPEQDSDDAFRSVTRRLRRGAAERSMKFIHLFSTHPPATRRADCSLLPQPQDITRTNARAITECALTRVVEFIDRLKELRVYDDTSIVLLSDHGYLELGNSRVEDIEDPQDWQKLLGRANPLLAVKRAGDEGRLTTDRAQMSITDVHSIVCSLAETCSTRTDDDWQRPDPDRQRPFLNYEWSTIFWNAPTLRGEERYLVRGPMLDPESWTELEADAMPRVEGLAFDRSDSPEHFAFGWRGITDGSRWTFGQSASLWLNLPRGNVRLTFEVARRPEHREQAIRFNVNGSTLTEEPIDGLRDTVTVVVPSEVAARAAVDEIQMRFAQHVPEEQRGDTNALAVRFIDLEID